jgi:hypothetical protein
MLSGTDQTITQVGLIYAYLAVTGRMAVFRRGTLVLVLGSGTLPGI